MKNHQSMTTMLQTLQLQIFFTMGEYPHYNRTNFDSDTKQIFTSLLINLTSRQKLERYEVKHLRTKLIHYFGWDESDLCFYDRSHNVFNPLKLRGRDSFISNEL